MSAILVPPAPVINPNTSPRGGSRPPTRHPDFESGLGVVTTARGRGGKAGAGFGVSVAAHTVLLAAIFVLPLVLETTLPEPTGAVRAFLAAPPSITPAPPPPPPPAPAAPRAAQRPAAATPPPPADDAFVAPVEVPKDVPVPEQLDLGGIEGGVEGGVEGGISGGVLGGIVGGITPQETAPIIRVGGRIKAPKLVHKEAPVYPKVASDARITGVVVIEARVDARGHVRDVRLVSGIPILSESALAAVQKWRYQPLLLNGQPTEFLVTVTVSFAIQ